MAGPFPSPPFRPPDADEAAALARSAAYLARAGAEAASRLLGAAGSDPRDALWAAVRDELLAGAALCEGLLDLPGAARPRHPPRVPVGRDGSIAPDPSERR